MNVRLLVVDDEADIRDMVSRHFRYLGFEVETAANGMEALSLMERNKFDIVISDIMMPVMGGIDLLRSIRQQYPMVHVVMLTGYVTLENALACMRLGADTCIFKPLEDLGELEGAVDRAVESIQNWLRILRELAHAKAELRGAES